MVSTAAEPTSNGRRSLRSSSNKEKKKPDGCLTGKVEYLHAPAPHAIITENNRKRRETEAAKMAAEEQMQQQKRTRMSEVTAATADASVSSSGGDTEGGNTNGMQMDDDDAETTMAEVATTTTNNNNNNTEPADTATDGANEPSDGEDGDANGVPGTISVVGPDQANAVGRSNGAGAGANLSDAAVGGSTSHGDGAEDQPADGAGGTGEMNVVDPLVGIMRSYCALKGIGVDKAELMAIAALRAATGEAEVTGGGDGGCIGGAADVGRLTIPPANGGGGQPTEEQMAFVRTSVGLADASDASPEVLLNAVVPLCCSLAMDCYLLGKELGASSRAGIMAAEALSQEKGKGVGLGKANAELAAKCNGLEADVTELSQKLETLNVEEEEEEEEEWEFIAHDGDERYHWVPCLLSGDLDRGHNRLLNSICDNLSLPRTGRMEDKVHRLRSYVGEKAAEARWVSDDGDDSDGAEEEAMDEE